MCLHASISAPAYYSLSVSFERLGYVKAHVRACVSQCFGLLLT